MIIIQSNQQQIQAMPVAYLYVITNPHPVYILDENGDFILDENGNKIQQG